MGMHHGQPRPTPNRHDEIMQFYRDLFAEKNRPAAPEPPQPARLFNPANPEEISTEEFYRRLFANELDETPAPVRQFRGDPDDGVSEAFFHRLFAEARQAKIERLKQEQEVANGTEKSEPVGKPELVPHDKKYWTFLPKPEACAKCQAMKDLYFEDEPQRPHPNCKCELKTAKASELPYDRNMLIVPPGVSLEENLAEARGLGRRATELREEAIASKNTAQSNAEEYARIYEYLQASFQSGGKYDYKQYGRQYEPFGNYHYGAYMKAFGWREFFIRAVAGLYQVHSGTAEWKDWKYYFDDPNDQYNIQRGMDSIQ